MIEKQSLKMGSNCDKCGECSADCSCDEISKDFLNQQKNHILYEILDEEENIEFIEDGIEIYIALRKKYPTNAREDLDNILNAMCTAVVCLMKIHIAEDDRRIFLQLVWHLLNSNI